MEKGNQNIELAQQMENDYQLKKIILNQKSEE